MPGTMNTVETLVEKLDRVRRRKKLSLYKLAREARLTPNSVSRLFEGYTRSSVADAWRVRDPEAPGRVRLETALRVAQVMGADLEVVMREPELGERKTR